MSEMSEMCEMSKMSADISPEEEVRNFFAEKVRRNSLITYGQYLSEFLDDTGLSTF